MTSPTFHDLAEEYLAVRRGLGFDLEWPGQLLLDFAQYVDGTDHDGQDCAPEFDPPGVQCTG